jgi:hypothetical protein
VDRERGSLSLVNTIEELLGRKSRGSGLEIREYGHRDPLCRPYNTLCPQKYAQTSSTKGGRSVGIVRLRTKASDSFVVVVVVVFVETHFRFLHGAKCAASCCHIIHPTKLGVKSAGA